MPIWMTIMTGFQMKTKSVMEPTPWTLIQMMMVSTMGRKVMLVPTRTIPTPMAMGLPMGKMISR